jgi:hypothetical protein
MAYEVLPRNPENESEFTRSIGNVIADRGNDNQPKPDKYNPRKNLNGDIEQSSGKDNRLHFGPIWQTHRVEVGGRELIYAYRPLIVFREDEAFKLLAQYSGQEPAKEPAPMAPNAEFYAHEFDENGLAARTNFREYENQIYKSRVTLFDACEGSGLPELQRLADQDELEQLRLVIVAPESNILALDGLVKVTKQDEVAIEKSRADYFARQREHAERMQDIADYHRQPITDDTLYSSNVIGL